MGGSYQCHICLREFSRSDSFRRHLESDICKQREDDPSDNSESQQDDDDNSSNEEDELPQSNSESSPWNKSL